MFLLFVMGTGNLRWSYSDNKINIACSVCKHTTSLLQRNTTWIPKMPLNVGTGLLTSHATQRCIRIIHTTNFSSAMPLNPLRLNSGAQIRLQHRCKDWGRVSIGGGSDGEVREGAVGCPGWAQMTAEGPRLSLAWWSQWKQVGDGGWGAVGVEEFMQLLRHRALSWWWGQGCTAGTVRQI